MLKLICILFFLTASHIVVGQTERTVLRPGWQGGIQYRPLLVTPITKREFKPLVNNGFSANMTPRTGHSFSVLVRYNFNRHVALEFGLGYTRRNHKILAEYTDSSWTDEANFGIINYEIPVQGLYYVRLGDNLYTNILAGFTFNFFPSDVESVGNNREMYQRSYRREWAGIALVANVGLEYRTEKSGYFYAGLSLHRPVQFIYSTYYYEFLSVNQLASQPIQGMYTGLDFRYFLPKSGTEKRSDRITGN
jgi:hypothetical protein